MQTELALILALGAAPAAAEAPLSAIDWLSESVEAPVRDPAPEPPVTSNGLPAEVTVTPLDRVVPDSVGLFDANERGLPADLWSASDAPSLARQIGAMRAPHLPVAQRLLHDIFAARAAAPTGSADGEAFFLTRVDALLSLGAFDPARRMMEAAGNDRAEIFRRWFDLTLLTGEENRACARMRALPEITPTYPARIFCLARSGDWPAAAVTLENAQALGVVTAAERERLARYLDEFATVAPLPPPPAPSPLDYMLYEAMGEPLPTPGLPLAFAHGDLRENTGWKMRIEAAERLARFGALSPARLWDIYGERAPAASGALWDRVGAAMKLERAMDDADALGEALPEAWQTASAAGLRPALAARYGARLATMPLDGEAGRIAREAALLAGHWDAIAELPPGPLARIVAGEAPGDGTPLLAAISAGLSGNETPGGAELLLQDGRVGEALIRAAGLLDAAQGGSLDATSDALAILVAAGQDARARRAAVELLILGDRR